MESQAVALYKDVAEHDHGHIAEQLNLEGYHTQAEAVQEPSLSVKHSTYQIAWKHNINEFLCFVT